MNISNHILGFPRIGVNRELKKAQENYWNKKISQKELLKVGKKIRIYNLKKQKKMGLDFLSVGDFSWYDHVLTTSIMLGNIPKRFINENQKKIDIDTMFYIARGVSHNNKETFPSEMTKWFNTNYHYIVPEFNKFSSFNFNCSQLLIEIDEALLIGKKVKPVILGPMSYLWLGKVDSKNFNCLNLLPKLLNVYREIFKFFKKKNIKWVQIDEPILSLELSDFWKEKFIYSYKYLKGYTKKLLTTYFGNISHNLDVVNSIPIDGVHIDIIYGNYDLLTFNEILSDKILLSLGIINGKNIWKSDLLKYYNIIKNFKKIRKNIWIGTSCSLLHIPIDINKEKKMTDKLKSYFSFAVQKCYEVFLLTNALNTGNIDLIKSWIFPLYSKKNKLNFNNKNLKKRLSLITEKDYKRCNEYRVRIKKQQKKLNLPIFPVTTIGSFPQTRDLRNLRLKFKENRINKTEYENNIFNIIKYNIKKQEELEIDVLVHGEPERNDMVEYFGEHLDGFLFTENGWVQSYGSRCVKPPIIIGDIFRSKKITIKWIKYAQSLTKKPVKGMLTGPITIFLWSFPREDLSYKIIIKQIALALKDEINDLEKNNINIIQIDEPALREGLPLNIKKRKKYLKTAINAFKLSVSSVKDTTQIHTHMCYCEFNDIIESITNLDADVITIEATRSRMDLLKCFKNFNYPNSIGPGFYDIHSPNIPTEEDILKLIYKSTKFIEVNKLWVNPDCGLKTRTWKESEKSLKNLVSAAKKMRLIKYS
ncbi:MAG: 5-methyltetrahydropteroyltriglutamate--homocysteine S-methyltransferase [Buchnera aphidicola (Periphyllus acericola)]|uniref:5-methyltetrahydropteroyltriglutamate-- homocysteine S-methyltransferase n=1 Tax=Buchnera aphidicola TaxID=9 RepID=UPI0030D1369F|nr:5-methyltetrahydropteroyltriglutamate--homocysteine S-methyltransferase [Buchnera aphidicola (Periphyllus acericola)]